MLEFANFVKEIGLNIENVDIIIFGGDNAIVIMQ